MLMLAAMRPSGTGGCAARYCEPSSPCSSAATAAKRMRAPRRLRQRGVRPRHARAAPPRPRRCPPRRCRWRPRRAWRRCLACPGDRGARCRAPTSPRELRVAAGQQAEHVRGRRARDLGCRSACDTCHAQRHGPEVAASAPRRTSSSRSCAAERGELAVASSVIQALHLQARPGRRREARTARRSRRSAPPATGSRRRRGVDDDRPGGADPRGLLVLVVPAAVPEPRPARRRAPGRPRDRC